MNGQTEVAGSAKVLAFPKGGRAGMERELMRKAIENDNRSTPVVVTDSWYHQAAIDQERKGH